MATPAKKTRGRQKVALERMEKDNNRRTTFSKRRGNVFTKASELCTLCGVQTLCIVFSSANNVSAFGHPSVEAIINRFLLEDNNLPQHNRVSTELFQNETDLRSNMEVSLLKDQVNIQKKRAEELLNQRKLKSEDAQRFLDPPESFSYGELKQIQATLIALRNNIHTHGNNLKAQANLSPDLNPSQNSQGQNPSLNPPSMLVGQNYNPNPTLVQSHNPPTFGNQSEMTMVPPPLVRDPNENTPMVMIPTPMSAFNDPRLAMGSNFMNTRFTHPNIVQPYQGPTNLIQGSFGGQNTMLTDMGWNPIPGDYQTFQNLLMGDGTLNSSATLSNPQGGYMGINPIPGDYQTFRNLMGEGSSNPFNPQEGFGFGPGFGPGMN